MRFMTPLSCQGTSMACNLSSTLNNDSLAETRAKALSQLDGVFEIRAKNAWTIADVRETSRHPNYYFEQMKRNCENDKV